MGWAGGPIDRKFMHSWVRARDRALRADMARLQLVSADVLCARSVRVAWAADLFGYVARIAAVPTRVSAIR
jgi:hypothetical protein